jgi:hypothetical protein
MNVMIETSGRDASSFGQIDHFFGAGGYRKLVVHFRINEIELAERSVDARMIDEMLAGRKALADSQGVRAIVDANRGGPYGSSVLRDIQQMSARVWRSVLAGELATESAGWYGPALILIVRAPYCPY